MEMFPIPKTVIAWHCGIFLACIKPHWMQSLVFKTLAFADQSNQRVKVLGLTVSLNWGNCPKYTKWCIIQHTVS